MQTLALSLLNGLVYGLLLFMLSSGLTLIYSMMGVLNFAHASFYMLGAYFAFEISRRIGFYPALIVSPLIVGTIGALVERYGLRRVHRYGHVAEILFTFGLTYLFTEIVQLIWGRQPVDYHVPASLDFPLFDLFAAQYPAYRVFMMAISVGMFALLYLLLKRTRTGLIIQAALTQPDMVGMLGHNVGRIFTFTFGLGCALAALAGVIGGNTLRTEPAMAHDFGPIAFVVIVLGGLGSISGAFIASLIVGMIQTFSVSFDAPLGSVLSGLGLDEKAIGFVGDLARISPAQVAPIVPYALLVLILLVRPRGLLGRREI